MKPKNITEGLIGIRVDADYTTKVTGPRKRTAPGFYNPAMVTNRSITVLLIRILMARWLADVRRDIKILDAMSSTGIRGLRILAESIMPEIGKYCKKNISIVFNDINPECIKIIKMNLEMFKSENSVPENINLIVVKKDITRYPTDEKFTYIDIDPFGTPMPYINHAVKILSKGGVIGVTATDTAVLFGTYPKVSKRRYLAYTAKVPFNYEMGLRTLIGTIIRVVGMHEIALKPIYSYYEGHYLRVFFTKDRGARATDDILSNIGYMLYNRDTGKTTIITQTDFEIDAIIEVTKSHGRRERYAICGPLYLGRLWDPKLSDKLLLLAKYMGKTYLPIIPLLERISCESSINVPFYYRTDVLASIFKKRAKKIEDIVTELRSKGFRAARTHFHPMGIRTDATVDEIVESFI